jgi:sulfur relay (sulfurtransferase) DsrF/TusC family protein
MLTLDGLREVNATTDVVTETGTEVVIVEDHVHQAIEAQGPLAVKVR